MACEGHPVLSVMRLLRSGRRERGFTLIELMVTLTVLAVLAVVAVPSFRDSILRGRLTTYANSFVGAVQLGRSEAVKRNARVKLCVSANGTQCVNSGGWWEQGWILFEDTDDNDVVGASENVILRQTPLNAGLHFNASVRSLVFLSTGETTQQTFTLCQATPVGNQERVVTVSATGRTAVATTRTGSCA